MEFQFFEIRLFKDFVKKALNVPNAEVSRIGNNYMGYNYSIHRYVDYGYGFTEIYLVPDIPDNYEDYFPNISNHERFWTLSREENNLIGELNRDHLNLVKSTNCFYVISGNQHQIFERRGWNMVNLLTGYSYPIREGHYLDDVEFLQILSA